MNIFDIFVCIIAVIAVINGWRRGFAVQACGLAALIVGIFVAAKTGARVGAAMGVDERFAAAAGFLVVFACILVLMLIAGRIIRKMFDFVGLGILDTVFGVIFSLLKSALILGILCSAFDRLNGDGRFVSKRKLDSSIAYRPLCDAVEAFGIWGRAVGEEADRIADKAVRNI